MNLKSDFGYSWKGMKTVAFLNFRIFIIQFHFINSFQHLKVRQVTNHLFEWRKYLR